MPCYSPLTAYRTRDGGITFSRNASVSMSPLKLPCGQCVGCRLERSRQWAVRCMNEARMHEANCFVTLTYDDEHLPDDRGLVKRDLQLFMKRLRKAHGPGIRFYGCGEYGENTKRPHYHVILFGWRPRDCEHYKRAKNGDQLYTSPDLCSIWGKGFVVIGDVTFESCAYVARYVVDKMTGPKADEWYTTDQGVIVQAEFTNMSRRPGIGNSYYKKYGAEVRTHDSLISRGMEVRPPRYYDTLTEALDPKRMALIKRKRRREAMKHQDEQTPERRRVKERHAVLLLNMWKRNVS